MITLLNLVQGTPEWLSHRENCWNASDAPAMMGVSKYESRSQFLKRCAAGEKKVIFKKLSDDGHLFERLALELAEKVVGDDLMPVTLSNDAFGLSRPLGASFDGITMDYAVSYEHKSMNDDLRACNEVADLHPMYSIQMEQQLMVSEGSRVLFMASKWVDGECIEKKQFWYKSNPELRAQIIAGWKQFEKDLAEFIESAPNAAIEMPAPEVTVDLPVLSIIAKGEITTSNMKEFGEALTKKLAEVRAIKLIGDQDFANANDAAKKFRDQIVKLRAAKEAMLAQTVTIGEASAMIDAWCKDLAETALQLEKNVRAEDLAKKKAMIDAAEVAYSAHVEALEAEITPIRLGIERPDFAKAIKGKSKYGNMQDAINDALTAGKLLADSTAADLRVKLTWIKEAHEGMGFLFRDLAQIITKPMEDFKLVVDVRVKDHKESEAKKEEAIRIQAEADARAKLEREEEERKAAQSKASEKQEEAIIPETIPETAPIAAIPVKSESGKTKAKSVVKISPDRKAIVSFVCSNYAMTEAEATDWLRNEFGK